MTKMTRDKAIEGLRNLVEDCQCSCLPLPVSMAKTLTPILAALSSPCACGGRKVLGRGYISDLSLPLFLRGGSCGSCRVWAWDSPHNSTDTAVIIFADEPQVP